MCSAELKLKKKYNLGTWLLYFNSALAGVWLYVFCISSLWCHESWLWHFLVIIICSFIRISFKLRFSLVHENV